MNALNNVRIGTKLIVSFIIVALIAAVVGVIGIFNIRTIDNADTELYQHYTVPIQILGDISTAFQRTRVNLREVVLSKDNAERAQYIQKIEDLRIEIDKSAAEYEKLLLTDAGKAAFDNFVQTRKVLQPLQTQIIELAQAGKTEEALELLRGDAFTAAAAEQEAIAKMTEMKVADAKEIADNNTILANSSTTTMIIAIVVGLLVGLALGIVLSNSITKPMQDGVVMMEEMSKGRLGMRLKFERKDEVGVLARAMDKFADDLQNVVVNAMQKIAGGDLNIAVTTKDNQDEIGPALDKMVATLKQLVDEMNRMSREQNAGDLDAKINVGFFQGVYKEMAQGVVDQVFEHLRIKRQIVDVVSQYSKGNFTPTMERLPGKKAYIHEAVDVVRNGLSDMINKINDAANNLNSAAAEILAATTQQASGASEQSAAITQTTTTVDEVKAISEQVVERAREVTDSSKRTVEVSVAGQKAVQETIDSMYQIKEKVEGIAENILALSEKTQQIGEIIATVNDIASQSNMLALNASIEAARAGEHGKGFSVVAMEVRNLAEQSKAATAQVGAILSEIQNATNTTVMVTEEGTKGVDRGVRLAAQSQEAIEKLAETIRESAQAAMQVMAGGQQQATGIEQIALAMKNINQVTVQSMASTKQAEKAAQNLNDLSRKLADTLQAYRMN
jgi:methyl-accepting chemotaxis protein